MSPTLVTAAVTAFLLASVPGADASIAHSYKCGLGTKDHANLRCICPNWTDWRHYTTNTAGMWGSITNHYCTTKPTTQESGYTIEWTGSGNTVLGAKCRHSSGTWKNIHEGACQITCPAGTTKAKWLGGRSGSFTPGSFSVGYDDMCVSVVASRFVAHSVMHPPHHVTHDCYPGYYDSSISSCVCDKTAASGGQALVGYQDSRTFGAFSKIVRLCLKCPDTSGQLNGVTFYSNIYGCKDHAAHRYPWEVSVSVAGTQPWEPTGLSCPVGHVFLSDVAPGTREFQCASACNIGTNQPGADYAACACKANYYADSSTTPTTCTACPSGKTKAGTNTLTSCVSSCTSAGKGVVGSVCQDCPAGKYSEVGSDGTNRICTGCSGNGRGVHEGTCKTCPAGWKSAGVAWSGTQWNNVCYICRNGFHQSLIGQTACHACPQSTYSTSPSTGSTACNVCPDGKYTPGGSGMALPTNCESCPAGKAVTLLPKGHGSTVTYDQKMKGVISTAQWNRACIAPAEACLQSSMYVSGQCRWCSDLGRAAGGANNACGGCIDASKQVDPSTQECVFACGSNEVGEKSSSSLPEFDRCVCKAGHVRDSSNNCVPCGAGKYRFSTGNAACTSCPAGTSKSASTIDGAMTFKWKGFCGADNAHDRTVAVMYEGNGDNPGTDEATRAAACNSACVHKISAGAFAPVPAKGFMVDRFTGRCFCQFSDSATCSRAWNAYDYDRYDLSAGCTRCAAGKYSGTAGSSECLVPPQHATMNSDRTGITCASGFVVNDAVTLCVHPPCSLTGPSGSVYNNGGTCGCTAGYYISATSCATCPTGRYKTSTEYTRTSCHACAGDQSTCNTGATSSSQCTCITQGKVNNGANSCVTVTNKGMVNSAACSNTLTGCTGNAIPNAARTACVSCNSEQSGLIAFSTDGTYKHNSAVSYMDSAATEANNACMCPYRWNYGGGNVLTNLMGTFSTSQYAEVNAESMDTLTQYNGVAWREYGTSAGTTARTSQFCSLCLPGYKPSPSYPHRTAPYAPMMCVPPLQTEYCTPKHGAGAECSSCPTGQTAAATVAEYARTMEARCTHCGKGWEPLSNAGASTCRQCPKGSYMDELTPKTSGSVTCKSCGSNVLTAATGSTSESQCTQCSDGYGISSTAVGTGRVTCAKCAAGKYSSNNQCVSCPAGKYNPTEGTTAGLASCLACQPGAGGWHVGADSSKCAKCPAGKYSASGAPKQCTDCANGKTATSEGQDSCSDCASGTTTTTASRSGADPGKCYACNDNALYSPDKSASKLAISVLADANADVCTECQANRVPDTTSGFGCKLCPGGQLRGADGSCTTCPQGKILVDGATSTARCDSCAEGKGPNSAGTACVECDNGYYSNSGTGFACTKCALGKGYDISATLSATQEFQGYCSDTSKWEKTYDYGHVNTGTNTAERVDWCRNICTSPTFASLDSKGFLMQISSSNPSEIGQCICFKGGYDPKTSTCARSNTGGDWYTYSLQSSGGTPTKSQCTVNCPYLGWKHNATGFFCQQCPAGTAADATHNTCVACPAGKAQGTAQNANGVTDNTCEACPAGHHTPAAGRTSCDRCPFGSYGAGGTSACTLCPNGKFSSSSAQHNDALCVSCSGNEATMPLPIGVTTVTSLQSSVYYYNRYGGSQQCKATCPAISGANSKYDSASQSCKWCSELGLPNGADAGTCASDCLAGHKKVNGQCVKCDAGKSSAGGTATSCTLCAEGKWSESGGACQSCPALQFPNAAHTACASCPGGKFATAGMSACENCPRGKFSQSGATQSCQDCTAGKWTIFNGPTTSFTAEVANVLAPGTPVTLDRTSGVPTVPLVSGQPIKITLKGIGASGIKFVSIIKVAPGREWTTCSTASEASHVAGIYHSGALAVTNSEVTLAHYGFEQGVQFTVCGDKASGDLSGWWHGTGLRLKFGAQLALDTSWHTLATGNTECAGCAAGHFSYDNGKCTACEPGKFRATAGHAINTYETCTTCSDSATTTRGAGGAQCDACKSNLFGRIDAVTGILQCGPAYGNSSFQGACAAGETTVRTTSAAAATKGYVACESCPAGKISTPALGCVDCPVDHYGEGPAAARTSGVNHCVRCMAGYSTNGTVGSALKSDCKRAGHAGYVQCAVPRDAVAVAGQYDTIEQSSSLLGKGLATVEVPYVTPSDPSNPGGCYQMAVRGAEFVMGVNETVGPENLIHWRGIDKAAAPLGIGLDKVQQNARRWYRRPCSDGASCTTDNEIVETSMRVAARPSAWGSTDATRGNAPGIAVLTVAIASNSPGAAAKTLDVLVEDYHDTTVPRGGAEQHATGVEGGWTSGITVMENGKVHKAFKDKRCTLCDEEFSTGDRVTLRAAPFAGKCKVSVWRSCVHVLDVTIDGSCTKGEFSFVEVSVVLGSVYPRITTRGAEKQSGDGRWSDDRAIVYGGFPYATMSAGQTRYKPRCAAAQTSTSSCEQKIAAFDTSSSSFTTKQNSMYSTYGTAANAYYRSKTTGCLASAQVLQATGSVSTQERPAINFYDSNSLTLCDVTKQQITDDAATTSVLQQQLVDRKSCPAQATCTSKFVYEQHPPCIQWQQSSQTHVGAYDHNANGALTASGISHSALGASSVSVTAVRTISFGSVSDAEAFEASGASSYQGTLTSTSVQSALSGSASVLSAANTRVLGVSASLSSGTACAAGTGIGATAGKCEPCNPVLSGLLGGISSSDALFVDKQCEAVLSFVDGRDVSAVLKWNDGTASTCQAQQGCNAGQMMFYKYCKQSHGSADRDPSKADMSVHYCQSCNTGWSSTTTKIQQFSNVSQCTAHTPCQKGTKLIGNYDPASGQQYAFADSKCGACPAGKFQNQLATPKTCTPVRTCAAGSGYTETYDATRDRNCAACIPGKYTATSNQVCADQVASCPAGSYFKTERRTDALNSCHQCPNGKFSTSVQQYPDPWNAQQAASASACTTHKVVTECGDEYRHYLQGPANSTADFTCKPRLVCTAGQQPKGGSLTFTSNNECEACASGKFAVGNDNRACQARTATCGAGRYLDKSKGDDSSNAHEDNECKLCPADGSYKDTVDGATSCTKKCASGHYAAADRARCIPYSGASKCHFLKANNASNPAFNQWYDASAESLVSDGSCSTVKDCQKGERVTADYSSNSDRQCASCAAGTFANAMNAPTCQAKTVNKCAPGTKVVNKNSHTHDYECQACASGTFSASHNQETCTTHRTCDLASQFIAQEASATQNRVCQTLTTCDWQNGRYETDPKTDNSDRKCATGDAVGPTACDLQTHYVVQDMGPTQPLICRVRVTSCPRGQYYDWRKWNATEHKYRSRGCHDCPLGRYQDEADKPGYVPVYDYEIGVVVYSTPCKAATPCAAGKFLDSAKSGAQDYTNRVAGDGSAVCSDCPDGKFAIGASFNRTSCQSYKVCGFDASTRVNSIYSPPYAQGDKVSDQTCMHCANGTIAASAAYVSNVVDAIGGPSLDVPDTEDISRTTYASADGSRPSVCISATRCPLGWGYKSDADVSTVKDTACTSCGTLTATTDKIHYSDTVSVSAPCKLVSRAGCCTPATPNYCINGVVDEYMVSPPSASSDAVCDPQPDCSAGTFVRGEKEPSLYSAYSRYYSANLTAPSACAGAVHGDACPSADWQRPARRLCDQCPVGSYTLSSNEAECTTQPVCDPATEYASVVGTSSTERRCSPRKACPLGHKRVMPAPTTVNGVEVYASEGTCTQCPAMESHSDPQDPERCIAHTAQCPAGYSYVNGTSTADASCQECDAGTTFRSAPSNRVDAGCAACTTFAQKVVGLIPEEYYVSSNCTVTTDLQITRVRSVCSKGQYESRSRGLYNDRECQPCPLGSFADTPNAMQCTTMTPRPSAEHYLVHMGSLSSDHDWQKRVAACPKGSKLDPLPKDATSSDDGSIGACVACASGLVSVKDASVLGRAVIQAHDNTHCVAQTVCNTCGYQPDAASPLFCENPQFIYAHGDATKFTECRAVTHPMGCPAGKETASGPSANADRVCQQCPDKYYKVAPDGTQASANNDVCVQHPVDGCGVGKYLAQAQNKVQPLACTDCPASRFRPTKGGFGLGANTVCASWTDGALCPKGTFMRTRGTTTQDQICEACPSGQHVDQSGLQTSCSPCRTCASGKYQTSTCAAASDRQCADCTPGYYSIGTNQPSCTRHSDCPYGTTWSSDHAKVGVPHRDLPLSTQRPDCHACGAGYEQPDGGLLPYRCYPCPPGTYNTQAKARHCAACPVGQYQDGYGGASCKTCPYGKWSSGAGPKPACDMQSNATHYIQRELDANGTHVAAVMTQRNLCGRNQVGTHANPYNTTACTDCPDNYYTAGFVYLPGDAAATGNPTRCVQCPAGKFRTQPGALGCSTRQPCDAGLVDACSEDGNSCCMSVAHAKLVYQCAIENCCAKNYDSERCKLMRDQGGSSVQFVNSQGVMQAGIPWHSAEDRTRHQPTQCATLKSVLQAKARDAGVDKCAA